MCSDDGVVMSISREAVVGCYIEDDKRQDEWQIAKRTIFSHSDMIDEDIKIEQKGSVDHSHHSRSRQ